jgi:head-tail adaptor
VKSLATRMRHRILIERSAVVDDGHNETEAWAELATISAQFIPSAGREAREAQQQLGREALQPASFRVRWSTTTAQIAPGGFRLRFPATTDGQVWDIKSAVEVKRREEIEIIALARSGATA